MSSQVRRECRMPSMGSEIPAAVSSSASRRAMSASTASRTASNSAVLSANWWYSAPRVTPAAATIASVDTSAKPCSAKSLRAAAISASRVAADRSACVRRARGPTDVGGSADVGDGAGVGDGADVGEGIAHSPTVIDLDKHTYSMYVLSMMTDHASAGLAVAELPQGRISYRAAGPPSSSRPPVMFLHGLLVDLRLWEPVAERLAAEGIRSYAPTLPLGAHERPMNADADLSPQGMAGLVSDFIAALGLDNVTVVGNDTGGAICQLLLAGDTGRIGAAVLTNCDAFGTFPPRALAPLFFAGRHPAIVACLVPGLRSARVRTGRLGFGPLTSVPLDAELTRGWIEPLAGKAIRRDLAKFARGVSPRVLLDAASRFSQFTGPVRIRGGNDHPSWGNEPGRQLREAFPHASLAAVPGGRTFLPLEHPDVVADENMAAAPQAARIAG